MPGRRRLTVFASLLTLVLLVVGAGLALMTATRSVAALLVIGVVAAPTSAGLSVLIARRQPANLVGPLLSFVGLGVAFVVTEQIGFHLLAQRPHTLSSLNWLVAGLNESPWWVFAAVALLVLYFPDGALPSAGWRWVPATLVLCTAISEVQGVTESFPPPLQAHRNPYGPAPVWFDVLGLVAFLLQLGLLVACAASLVVRFRRADRVRRTQIKWLALVGVAVPMYPLLCLAEIALWGRPLWFSSIVVASATVGIPIATAIAVLRHDLYDVDKALAGSATWVLFSIVLFLIYGASALAAGLVLDRGSATVAAAVTALCALTLSPLRLRLQRRVDSRLYPLRRSALAAVETLHHQVSTGDARPEELEHILRTALRDAGLRVGYDVPGTDGFVDVDGVRVETTGATPIVLGGMRIGLLVPGCGGVASPELLRQVGDAAATLVEVVRLRLEVANALREVQSSRARLVHIGYE
ncbi:MAG: two-component sensor histidine kinase, partial [Actinomycetota bacterium]|nr:two-component sensor histidine kinase [Actinomycetota bacterium]